MDPAASSGRHPAGGCDESPDADQSLEDLRQPAPQPGAGGLIAAFGVRLDVSVRSRGRQCAGGVGPPHSSSPSISRSPDRAMARGRVGLAGGQQRLESSHRQGSLSAASGLPLHERHRPRVVSALDQQTPSAGVADRGSVAPGGPFVRSVAWTFRPDLRGRRCVYAFFGTSRPSLETGLGSVSGALGSRSSSAALDQGATPDCQEGGMDWDRRPALFAAHRP